jgi:hypothetical protein
MPHRQRNEKHVLPRVPRYTSRPCARASWFSYQLEAPDKADGGRGASARFQRSAGRHGKPRLGCGRARLFVSRCERVHVEDHANPGAFVSPVEGHLDRIAASTPQDPSHRLRVQ